MVSFSCQLCGKWLGVYTRCFILKNVRRSLRHSHVWLSCLTQFAVWRFMPLLSKADLAFILHGAKWRATSDMCCSACWNHKLCGMTAISSSVHVVTRMRILLNFFSPSQQAATKKPIVIYTLMSKSIWTLTVILPLLLNHNGFWNEAVEMWFGGVPLHLNCFPLCLLSQYLQEFEINPCI